MIGLELPICLLSARLGTFNNKSVFVAECLADITLSSVTEAYSVATSLLSMKGNSYPMEIIHLAEVEAIENRNDVSFCHILSREGLTSMT